MLKVLAVTSAATAAAGLMIPDHTLILQTTSTARAAVFAVRMSEAVAPVPEVEAWKVVVPHPTVVTLASPPLEVLMVKSGRTRVILSSTERGVFKPLKVTFTSVGDPA